jgi:hypothetical protein
MTHENRAAGAPPNRWLGNTERSVTRETIEMKPEPKSEIILYRMEDGQARVQCRFEDENVWLTQAQIAELFGTTPQNITLHLRAIYAEKELREAATCKDYLQVRSEGARQVQRALRHYSLEAIEGF